MNARASWHDGESALQARVGMAARMAEIGPLVLRDHMPEVHRQFFAQLPFVIVGSVDEVGQPTASVLAAPPGFAHSPDPRHLRVDAVPRPTDPLAAALRPGASIGLLGIEPHTRRRNRMNGVVVQTDAQGFGVEVRQSFGNCPRYIQAREAHFVDAAHRSGEPRAIRIDTPDAAAARIVRSADTFFIATAHAHIDASVPSQGVDVSHRGGRPGFVRLDEGGTLTVPDFAGNAFFNTLGNIAVNPRAGLLFVDFESGDLLQLAVTAEVVWGGPELAAFDGAERLLRMKVLSALHTPKALSLRFGPASLSPHLASTGRWSAAA